MTRNLCFMAELGNYFEQNYPCCVVPENIHTSHTEGNGNSDVRGSRTRKFPKGRGVASRGFFPGGPSKIGELLINNNFSVELATSYLTLNSCFKTIIIVCIIHLIYGRSECFFHGLHDIFLIQLSSSHK